MESCYGRNLVGNVGGFDSCLIFFNFFFKCVRLSKFTSDFLQIFEVIYEGGKVWSSWI